MASKKNRKPADDNDDGSSKKIGNNKMVPRRIAPLTDTQAECFEHFRDFGRHLWMEGSAGTGKTFLAIAMALGPIFNDPAYNKIYICRSIVPSREIGYLPGNTEEKAKEYLTPYIAIVNEIFARGDAWSILETKGYVEFITTSFNRGITLSNCILIVDEAQNMSAQELNTIMTRIGNDCRVIFCGDTKQDDLKDKKGPRSGYVDFRRIIREIDEFAVVTFTPDDIVRSGLVRKYLLTRARLESQGTIEEL